MYSPELIRYIIDPKGSPVSQKESITLKHSYSEYDNVCRDIKSMRCNDNVCCKLFRFFQKYVHSFGRE